MKILLIADIKDAKTAAEAHRILDAFRETTLPGPEYRVCLYQPDGAMNSDRPIIQLQEGENYRQTEDGLTLLRNFDGFGNPAVFFNNRQGCIDNRAQVEAVNGEPRGDYQHCLKCGEDVYLPGLAGENADRCPRCGTKII